MAAPKDKKKAGSTQKFTEIKDIREDIVLLEGANACLIIEAQAINFALLSPEEQLARIATYSGLLNSLTFPIQILIRNKQVDISSYLGLLEKELSATRNEKLANYIRLYHDFVKTMIKVNTVLDKKFYLILPFSSLEKGPRGALSKTDEVFTGAKAALHTKAETLLTQLARLSLRAKILDQQGLIKLFYDIYNQQLDRMPNIKDAIEPPSVQGMHNK